MMIPIITNCSNDRFRLRVWPMYRYSSIHLCTGDAAIALCAKNGLQGT